MTNAEILFIEIGSKLSGALKSQMFGKPCYKIKGKAFICFFKNEMVFKLPIEIKIDALNLSGAKLFDPSGKNRPMKEWIQVPYKYSEKWLKFAIDSFKYIQLLSE